MEQQSDQLRVRVLRVFDEGARLPCKYIVIVDVEQNRYWVGSSSGWAAPPKRREAKIDRLDARNALDALRELGRSPDVVSLFKSQSEPSIDAAISAAVVRRRQLFKQVRIQETPSHETVENGNHEAGTPQSKQSMVVWGGSSQRLSKDERRIEAAQDKELWDFAGGMRWQWKAAGHTPAGYPCETLTFSGSEEVIVGSTSIAIPNRK